MKSFRNKEPAKMRFEKNKRTFGEVWWLLNHELNQQKIESPPKTIGCDPLPRMQSSRSALSFLGRFRGSQPKPMHLTTGLLGFLGGSTQPIHVVPMDFCVFSSHAEQNHGRFGSCSACCCGAACFRHRCITSCYSQCLW